MLSIAQVKREIENIAPLYGIKKASLFGSYADGTATEDSDVDLLLEFDTKSVSLFKLAAIRLKLEESIGKNVDVIHSPLPKNSFIKINNEVALYEQRENCNCLCSQKETK